MNADGFRKIFDYHFRTLNLIWEHSISELSEAQFTQALPYSVGSIRNQLVHLISIDERWLAGLRGLPVPDFLDPTDFPNREAVRAKFDATEADIRSYLESLRDEMLTPMYTQHMAVWEVLYHVANHGTDHRAQILAMLNLLEAPSFPQDYFYFAHHIDVAQPQRA